MLLSTRATAALAGNQGSGIPLAWGVLALLVVALLYTALAVWRGSQGLITFRNPPALRYGIPVLAAIGLGVAAYLAYIELTETSAVCGPVGDCNAVQSSPYARLFGIPVGVVGLAGYGFILAAFFWGARQAWLSDQMPLLLFCGALVSALFSLYLTSVEIFVIGAVCMWCLSSAVLAALILLLSADPLLQSGGFLDD